MSVAIAHTSRKPWEKKALKNYFQVIKLHCFSFATGHTQPEDVIVVQTVSDASLPCQLPVQG